jgi:hypothetical protein
MTFAEIAIFIAVGAALYLGMAPLRRRLEFRLYKFLAGKRKGSRQVIDITDYTKKNDPK